MSNSAQNMKQRPIGAEGVQFHLPVAASTHIYEGTLISQLTSSGYAVPYSTSSSGHCVGVAEHESDNTSGSGGDKRLMVETRRIFAFKNGASSDAFADTDAIGAPVYASDDHTVAKTSSTNSRKPVGFFVGFEPDGKVRVFIDPITARLYAALAGLTDSPATVDALRDDIVGKVAV